MALIPLSAVFPGSADVKQVIPLCAVPTTAGVAPTPSPSNGLVIPRDCKALKPGLRDTARQSEVKASAMDLSSVDSSGIDSAACGYASMAK
jgi:hypothetical protein